MIIKAKDLKSGMSFLDIAGRTNVVTSAEFIDDCDAMLVKLSDGQTCGINSNLDIKILEEETPVLKSTYWLDAEYHGQLALVHIFDNRPELAAKAATLAYSYAKYAKNLLTGEKIV